MSEPIRTIDDLIDAIAPRPRAWPVLLGAVAFCVVLVWAALRFGQ